MSDLRELYQQVILDHYKRPRNFHRLERANRKAEGHNPLCGDEIVVYLKMNGDVIEDISFEGAGCAISTASASMMADALRGCTRAEAEALFRGFESLLAGSAGEAETAALGELGAFAGVRRYPVRVKCARLPWQTLMAALTGGAGTVTTE